MPAQLAIELSQLIQLKARYWQSPMPMHKLPSRQSQSDDKSHREQCRRKPGSNGQKDARRNRLARKLTFGTNPNDTRAAGTLAIPFAIAVRRRRPSRDADLLSQGIKLKWRSMASPERSSSEFPPRWLPVILRAPLKGHLEQRAATAVS